MNDFYILTRGEYLFWFLVAVAIGYVGRVAVDRVRWGADPRIARLEHQRRELTIALRGAIRIADSEEAYATKLLREPDFYRLQRAAHLGHRDPFAKPSSAPSLDILA